MVNRFASLADEEEVRTPAPKVEAPAPAKPAQKDQRNTLNRRNQRNNGPRGNGPRNNGPRRGRQFDRHSGTGRGRENSKNGAGAHNWGNRKDPKEELKNETAPVENAEEAVETPVEAAPVEPEEHVLTVTEYLKQQKEKMSENTNELFKPLEIRKVEKIQGEKLVKVEEDYFVGAAKKTHKEKAQKERNLANDTFKFTFSNRRYDNNNNRNYKRRERRVDVNSEKDFPALC